jgi:hypothetical protein
VRASSLSCLGTLARLLRYALHGALQDLLDCFIGLACTDPAAEVRRGAAYALSQMLVGLGDRMLTVMPDHLSTTYRRVLHCVSFPPCPLTSAGCRALKAIAEDPDEVVRHHARAGLQAYGETMSKLALPVQPRRPKLVIRMPTDTI